MARTNCFTRWIVFASLAMQVLATPGRLTAQSYDSPTASAPPPGGQFTSGNASAGAASLQRPGLEPIEEGQIIARIGASEVVLAAEVLPAVNETIARNQQQIPPHEIDQVRRILMQQHLKPIIERKLIVSEARRTIPDENFPQIKERVKEQFDKNRLPDLYKATETNNRADLDAALQQFGTSLAQQEQVYVEMVLARQWVREQLGEGEEVTREEMLAYYREHQAEYAYEAAARWEELMVRFDRFPNKQAAYAAIAQLGLAVQQGGPFAEIARAQSHGVTAERGGQYDWTTQGSLVSGGVDRAIFALPVGQLSEIFEDPVGWHIVRVVERRDAGRVPFTEAQAEIRERIEQQRQETRQQEYLAGLHEKVHVWTIFDDQPAAQFGAAPTEPVQR
ncbi:MAG: peptidylprolyl isomerase [Pirellulales bacterium]